MSWMEVKIHLHHQQISKSTVRTLSKMQAATSAQELSIRIVNRSIRNITNNGNQTIKQTMATMITTVTETIATTMIFQIRLKVKKSLLEFGDSNYFRNGLKQCI